MALDSVKKIEDCPTFSRLYIDGDILVYEMPFAAEYKNDSGERQVRDFEFVEKCIENWDAFIKTRLGCDNVSYFLTGKGNFREKVAVSTPYKEKRGAKPFHYEATRQWLELRYGAEVVEGMEADDMLCYLQQQALDNGNTTCIVSRDKDLKMTRGHYYSWPVHNQAENLQFGGEGWLSKDKVKGKTKINGGGIHWFYYQLLVGDVVDSIPALKGVGPVAAYKALSECKTEEEMLSAVRCMYHERGHDDAYLVEQGQLLWMTTEMKDGKPVLWWPK